MTNINLLDVVPTKLVVLAVESDELKEVDTTIVSTCKSLRVHRVVSLADQDTWIGRPAGFLSRLAQSFDRPTWGLEAFS